eukprot:gene19506-26174_t
MSCPFGFQGGEGAGDVPDWELDDEDIARIEMMLGHSLGDDDAQAKGALPNGNSKQKKTKKTKVVGGLVASGGGVHGFKEQGIETEADFQAKRDFLKAEAQRRLDHLEASRKKLRELEGSEFGSLFSSNLSELDSDNGSLASLKSCAEDWIEAAKYSSPAESAVKLLVPACLAVAGGTAYQSFSAISVCQKVLGIVQHTWWPNLACGLAVLLAIASLLAYGAATLRSKKFLLSSLICCIATFGASLVLLAFMTFQPTAVDHRLIDAACRRFADSDSVSRLCGMIPGVELELGQSMDKVFWSTQALAVAGKRSPQNMWAPVLVWYVFELMYIEKKGLLHQRRQKRTEHSIPWDKIKIIDWATATARGDVSARDAPNPPAGGDGSAGDAPNPHVGGDVSAGDAPKPPAGGDGSAGDAPKPPAGRDVSAGDAPKPPAGGDVSAGDAPKPPAGGDGNAGNVLKTPTVVSVSAMVTELGAKEPASTVRSRKGRQKA